MDPQLTPLSGIKPRTNCVPAGSSSSSNMDAMFISFMRAVKERSWSLIFTYAVYVVDYFLHNVLATVG